MNERLNETEQEVWNNFVAAKVQLLERLDHELQQRSGLSLTDYEILSVLADASGHRVRMSELADRVLVSRSRLTYRVDRLAHLGYVSREECLDDRRGLFAILTEEGQEARASAEPGHVRDVRTWFFDLIEPEELQVLGDIMENISAKMAAN